MTWSEFGANSKFDCWRASHENRETGPANKRSRSKADLIAETSPSASAPRLLPPFFVTAAIFHVTNLSDFPTVLGRGKVKSLQSTNPLCRHNVIRAHHLVVFVLENMTVPNIPTEISIEAYDYSRNHLGFSTHGIFPSSLVLIGRMRITRK